MSRGPNKIRRQVRQTSCGYHTQGDFLPKQGQNFLVIIISKVLYD